MPRLFCAAKQAAKLYVFFSSLPSASAALCKRERDRAQSKRTNNQ